MKTSKETFAVALKLFNGKRIEAVKFLTSPCDAFRGFAPATIHNDEVIAWMLAKIEQLKPKRCGWKWKKEKTQKKSKKISDNREMLACPLCDRPTPKYYEYEGGKMCFACVKANTIRWMAHKPNLSGIPTWQIKRMPWKRKRPATPIP